MEDFMDGVYHAAAPPALWGMGGAGHLGNFTCTRLSPCRRAFMAHTAVDAVSRFRELPRRSASRILQAPVLRPCAEDTSSGQRPNMTASPRHLLRSLWSLVPRPSASARLVTRVGRYDRLGAESRQFIAALRREIDADEFADIQRRHATDVDVVRRKYLDLETWLGRHLTHAEGLGLFGVSRRRILDIGTGNGYFPFICTRLGHDVVATDVDNVGVYDDLIALLGVRRIVHAVEMFRPLPDFGGRFDLVTAFNTVFDRIDETATWTSREWGFLLEDLRANLLKPDAEIVLKLNPNRRRVHDKLALARFFRSLGGDVALPFVHLRVAGGAFVPVASGCHTTAA